MQWCKGKRLGSRGLIPGSAVHPVIDWALHHSSPSNSANQLKQTLKRAIVHLCDSKSRSSSNVRHSWCHWEFVSFLLTWACILARWPPSAPVQPSPLQQPPQNEGTTIGPGIYSNRCSLGQEPTLEPVNVSGWPGLGQIASPGAREGSTSSESSRLSAIDPVIVSN